LKVLPGLHRFNALAAFVALSLVLWSWATDIVHVRPAAFDSSAGHPTEPPGAPVRSSALPVALPVALTPARRPAVSDPLYRERFASGGQTAQVHASTAYLPRSGGLTAFWYGGSREGAQDVSIYSARLDRGEWDAARIVIDRKRMKAELNRHIRKIGNATVYRHPDGRLWLFFVTVSVGGWAGSAINLAESPDDGQTWSRARRLVTSPMLNLSTLVRSSAFRYEDGSVGLPVYHEFVGKFAELLRIAPDGRILAKTRFTAGRQALQPEIAILGPDRAVGLLRYAGGAPRRLMHMTTENAGRSWSTPVKIPMPNPDAAVDVVALGGDRLLAVLNDLDEGRNRLVLTASENLGRDWRMVQVLEHDDQAPGSNESEFSYPWLERSAGGEFHVLYTWNRTRIKHIHFNQHWLNSRRLSDAVR